MKYVNKDLIKKIATGAIGITFIIGANKFVYNYEVQYQDIETMYKMENVVKDDSGKIYKIFEPGEHKITITRNDLIYNSENFEGYIIESVKKDVLHLPMNLKIIYVNTEPVIVKATEVDDNIVYFNEFGTPQKNKELTKQKK
ncbi:MAG: hypothetical protein IJO32_07850 [Bacilli bacterium]|nr:hypothetical protein [Bacilli bacterium]